MQVHQRHRQVFLYNIISQVNPDNLSFIANVVESPLATDKYNTTKRRLLDLFDQSEESKVRHFLRTCRMGDEKPSHFLQRLRSLARNHMFDAILQSIFLEHIPPSCLYMTFWWQL